MAVTIQKNYQRDERWVPLVLVSDGGQSNEVSLELLVRRPTFAEQIAAKASEELIRLSSRTGRDNDVIDAFANAQRDRIKLVVKDWRGVNDDAGNVVPYSPEMLELLISQYPQALDRVVDLVNDNLVTFAGDLKKNLPSPQNNGGTGTQGETEVSTDCLPSGTD